MVVENEKEELHVHIGRILQEGFSDSTPAVLIFKAVDQFNRGLGCISDRDEQVELALLNARAGEEAYKACAFTPSLTYTQKCLDILDTDNTVWTDHYELALNMYNLLAELNYCQGNYHGSMQIVGRIFEKAKTFEDKFIAQTCNTKSLMLMGKLDTALSSSLVLLRKLGEPLPKKPGLGAIMAGLMMTKKALRNKTDEYLISLPEMTSNRIIKVMKTLAILQAVTYQMGSDYFVCVNFKMIRLTLRYGHHGGSPSFAFYGMLMYAILGDLKGAYRFGQLALTLSNKASPSIPVTYMVVYGLITHWRDNVVLTFKYHIITG